jgi:hypothetical protein
MYKKSLFLLIAFFSFCYQLRAQGVIKGFEYGEIINIAEAYRQAPSLSFDLQFNYTDSVRQDSIIEQIPGSYKIQNGMYWAMIDSTEILQGNNYNVTVLHYDSVITISNPQQYTNVFQLPFMDSLFRAQNVDSMNVTVVNDSTRSLRMYFNPASFYSSYIINYDLNTYMMDSITYFIKTPAYDDDDNDSGMLDGDEGSGISMIKIIFNNYSTQAIDQSYFDESKFIYKQGGQFFARPEYADFQLLVNTSNL